MRWEAGHQSDDVEDRRGARGLPIGGARLGCGGFVILLVLSLLFGKNFFALVGEGGQPPRAEAPRVSSGKEQKLVEFVSFVLDDVQATWTDIFRKRGQTYPRAKMVLFTDSVRSGCGYAESAMGPFYCPADEKVYLDLGFYRDLQHRFGAPGDFAEAYVIAHEVGHHVQNVLGYERKLRREQEAKPNEANHLSVRMELQADCFAGVWGHSTDKRNLLERGDIDEGLNAAAAIGDDRIQKQAGVRVNPERWTHGSSKQRVKWFRRGLDAGKIDVCDTFAEVAP